MSEAANAQVPIAPTADVVRGQMLAGRAWTPNPEQEATQRAFAEKHEADYRAREEAERKERYDLQQIVNRQTALHAALMMEPKPDNAASLIESATAIHGFLIGS